MNEIIIYQDSKNQVELKVQLKNDTLWLSQKQMAELFNKDSDTIGFHLKNIFSSGELHKDSTTEKYSVVRIEGNREVNRKIQFYNLDEALATLTLYIASSKPEEKETVKRLIISVLNRNQEDLN